MLLQSVGFQSPDDVSIQDAIAVQDELVKRLCEIRDVAQRRTIEHHDQ
jgi:hypothetical protein